MTMNYIVGKKLKDFKAWGNGYDTLKKADYYGEVDALEDYLNDLADNLNKTFTETELNDLLSFNDTVLMIAYGQDELVNGLKKSITKESVKETDLPENSIIDKNNDLSNLLWDFVIDTLGTEEYLETDDVLEDYKVVQDTKTNGYYILDKNLLAK